MAERSLETIAIQQIVNEGKGNHSCCICYKFTSDNPEVTKKHLLEQHKTILELIQEAQK